MEHLKHIYVDKGVNISTNNNSEKKVAFLPSDFESKILPLSPRNDLKGNRFDVYEKYLTQAFDNPLMHNIALGSSLGSGKSSILRSFDRQRSMDRERFLYVSLIDFSETKRTEKDAQKDLEHSIMSQLVSCCSQRDLPESSIRGIPERLRWLRLCAFYSAAICFAVFVLVFEERFATLAERLGFPPEARVWIHLLLYLAVGVSLGIFVYKFLNKLLPKTQVSKLTLKSDIAEAEVAFSKDPTALDMYKFEMAYALAAIGPKIDYTVVFEDMERLHPPIAVDIMTKLRELNSLTNNHIEAIAPRWKCSLRGRWKKSKKYRMWRTDPNSVSKPRQLIYRWLFRPEQHIRFIYVVKDAIFPLEHRTKFFDCIIPVVPALNPLNSEQIFNEQLSMFGISNDNEYAKVVVQALSPVLTDYRTLLTLQNEYLVYWDLYRAQTSHNDEQVHPDQATLLAVVAYKVLFPWKFTAALASDGPGFLTPITAVELENRKEYDSGYADKLVESIQQLFKESILDITCLRMVGMTDVQMLEHWLNILKSAIRDSVSKNTIRNMDALIAGLCFPQKESAAQELLAEFRKAIISEGLLNKSQESEAFIMVAKCLAATSGKEESDWDWFFGRSIVLPDEQKKHFTSCFKFLSAETTLPETFQKQLRSRCFIWCTNIMMKMEIREMADVFKWDDQMADTLAKYLCEYHDTIVRHYQRMAELIITGDCTLLQLIERVQCTPVL